MSSVVILRRAELEIIDACEWYERQQVGLSARYRTAIDKRISLIAQNPLIFPSRIRSEFRVASLTKFPYLIVYWYEESTDTIFISSVFHTKRDPRRLK